MNLIIFSLIICFLLFLYILYFLAKDDFVIVRKDVSMEKIFNLAFLTSIVALFFSRAFYVLFNPLPSLLSPLGFLAFPYFPGLSLLGGMIGGSAFIYFYANYKKMPAAKLLDLFTMSFSSVLPVGFVITYILLLGKTSLFYNALLISSIFLFFVFSKLISPFAAKGEIKDGSLGIMYILFFSFVYFTEGIFINIKTFSFVSWENIIVLITLFVSLILLINHEIVDRVLSKK